MSWTIFGLKTVDVRAVSENVQISSLVLDSGSRNLDTADTACLYSDKERLDTSSLFAEKTASRIAEAF